MSREHVIAEELLEQAQISFSKNEHWIAYNVIPYFLEKGYMYFFKTSDEAHEFSNNNISEFDNYHVMHANSLDEFLKRIPYGEELDNKLSDTKNLSIMNEKNFEYLKDNLKYMGFGEKQTDSLETHLKEGKETFQLTFSTEVNKKPFEAVLQFRKSDSSDMYFFNSYHATLERTNGDKVDQTFYLNKGKGVTAKEAYNLLEGRSVFKELNNKAGEPYKAWIQLDIENKDKNNNHEVKQFHENYGYDVRAAVGKYAVVELDGGEKEKSLLQSLQKGNVQSVTIERGEVSHKMFMEANPQFKTVTLYDNQMKRVQKESLEQYQSVQSLGKDLKQNNEQEKQEVHEEKKQGKKTGKNKDEDEEGGLLPKKKTRQKKGLGLS